MFATLSILLSVSAAFAQFPTISSNCSSALAGISLNTDSAACLSPGSVFTLFLGGENSSIVEPVDNWISTICAADACSNDTIAAVVSNVTTGCSTELTALGYNLTTDAVQQAYPVFRQILCLSQSGTNCITQTLENIQDILGTLTIDSIYDFVNDDNITLPSNVTCTDCIQEAYIIANATYPDLVSDEESYLQCGTNFTNGTTTPSDVTESAPSATAGSSVDTASNTGYSLVPKDVLVGIMGPMAISLSATLAFLI